MGKFTALDFDCILNQQVAPNDTYSDTVLRGAISCGLSWGYCQQLLSHMTQLQSKIS